MTYAQTESTSRELISSMLLPTAVRGLHHGGDALEAALRGITKTCPGETIRDESSQLFVTVRRLSMLTWCGHIAM